jgi:cold shock CspA family protein
MITLEPPQPDRVGHVAYIEPLKQWGYLHGPAGERVYFHASGMRDGLSELELGDEVRYRVAPGGDRTCAVHVLQSTRRDR